MELVQLCRHECGGDTKRSAAKLEKVHEGQVKLEGAIDALRRSVDLVVRAVQNGQHAFSVHEAGLDNIMGKEDKDLSSFQSTIGDKIMTFPFLRLGELFSVIVTRIFTA